MSTGHAMPPAVTTGSGEEAFGLLAASYDRDFETLPAARRLRSIIWNIYLRYFTRGDSLLELNCGTGTDALALAQHGIKIHATDISSAMLETLHQKVAHSSEKNLVTAQRLPFNQLHTLRGRLFDGAYSNMAGLNCERDLKRVALDLNALLKPGGIFIGTFLGDIAIWDMCAFLARGKVQQAFRRRNRDGCPANVGGSVVQTFYYSPDAVTENFLPHFTLVELVGLNIFTPPPTSLQAYRRFGKAISLLEGLDDAVMRNFPFNRIGDHFVVVLRHTG